VPLATSLFSGTHDHDTRTTIGGTGKRKAAELTRRLPISPGRAGAGCTGSLKGTERAAILRELSDYNLNAFSLLGSQESLMETISVREELAGAKFRIVEAMM
jgi:hypothetical protein